MKKNREIISIWISLIQNQGKAWKLSQSVAVLQIETYKCSGKLIIRTDTEGRAKAYYQSKASCVRDQTTIIDFCDYQPGKVWQAITSDREKRKHALEKPLQSSDFLKIYVFYSVNNESRVSLATQIL